MFVSHFALAFAAKPLAPRVSLGVLFAAAQFADLLWPVLVLAGLERFSIDPGATAVTPLRFDHYPYSHGLLALGLLGPAGAAAYAAATRASARTAAVLAALVVSHWVLDAFAHAPDLPWAPGVAARAGLGLWHSVPATLAVEFALLGAGVALYLRRTAPRDRRGTWGIASLVAFLAIVELANVLGPPPPSVDAVTVSALAVWAIVGWAAWADRHRVSAERRRRAVAAAP